MGLAQLYNVAQQFQVVRSLFQHVAHQNQNVVRGEVDLLQKMLKEGEIAVDITDGQNTPSGGELRMDYDSMLSHGYPPSYDNK